MPWFDTLDGMTEVDVAPSELADWLIGRGRHFISTSEVAALYGLDPESVPSSLERSREAGKLLSVTKGGWVPVPAEYRSAGAPPPSHFIDQLMGYLGHHYYVGFLSAAAIHGASHQSPMVFQVVTAAKLRNRKVGRARLQFVQRSAVSERPTQPHNVPTGRIKVATPEVVVFDLVEAPHDGGGLSNVATVVGELLADGKLAPELLRSAGQLYPAAVCQRAGHLIDVMADEVGVEFDSDPLHDLLTGVRYRDLAPGRGDGAADERWHVVVNTDIEHDL